MEFRRIAFSLLVIVFTSLFLPVCSSDDENENGGLTGTEVYDTYFVGHSMVNNIMPGYVRWLIDSDPELTSSVGALVNGGQNIGYNYENRDASVDYGSIANFIAVEEHCLRASEGFALGSGAISDPNDDECNTADAHNWVAANFPNTWHTDSYGGFYNDIAGSNSSAAFYLYEDWLPVRSDTESKTLSDLNDWRDLIDSQILTINAIVNEFNSEIGDSLVNGPELQVVPVARAASRLVGEICAGNISNLSDPERLFSDGVHPSEDVGNYFIALVQYAVIFDRDPTGLTLTGNGQTIDGEYFLDFIDDDTAADLQALVWDVINNNGYSSPTDISSCPGLGSGG